MKSKWRTYLFAPIGVILVGFMISGEVSLLQDNASLKKKVNGLEEALETISQKEDARSGLASDLQYRNAIRANGFAAVMVAPASFPDLKTRDYSSSENGGVRNGCFVNWKGYVLTTLFPHETQPGRGFVVVGRDRTGAGFSGIFAVEKADPRSGLCLLRPPASFHHPVQYLTIRDETLKAGTTVGYAAVAPLRVDTETPIQEEGLSGFFYWVGENVAVALPERNRVILQLPSPAHLAGVPILSLDGDLIALSSNRYTANTARNDFYYQTAIRVTSDQLRKMFGS